MSQQKEIRFRTIQIRGGICRVKRFFTESFIRDNWRQLLVTQRTRLECSFQCLNNAVNLVFLNEDTYMFRYIYSECDTGSEHDITIYVTQQLKNRNYTRVEWQIFVLLFEYLFANSTGIVLKKNIMKSRMTNFYFFCYLNGRF